MVFSSISKRLARAPDSRFARITTNDHSAKIWVIALLSTTYAILLLAVRLGFTKWRAHTLDDIIVTMAYLVAFGMWGSLFTSLRNGLGKSYILLEDAEISIVQQYFFASQMLFYIALALSKCSILILIRTVFTQNSRVSKVAISTNVLVVIWGLVGVVVSAVSCSAENIMPEPGSEHCTSLVPWLRVLSAGDVLTEIVIISLPIIGFHTSLMSIKCKAIIMLAFFTRIPNIAFAIIHLLAYSKFISNHQPAISIVPTVVWQSVLLSYNLMSATTPLLKGFTQGFGTAGMSLGYLRETMTTSGGSGTSRSYELRSLAKTKSRSKVSPQDVTNSQLRATSVQRNTKPKSAALKTAPKKDSQCYHESASIASHDSRRIMINRNWKMSEG